jgi:hypothetical protein
MKRVFSLAMTTIVASFTVGALQAVPASANDEYCADGYVCAWEDPFGGGTQYVEQPAVAGRYEIDWWNGDNELSHIANNTHCKVTWYKDDGQSGASWTMDPGSFSRDLRGSSWNDNIESYMIWGC